MPRLNDRLTRHRSAVIAGDQAVYSLGNFLLQAAILRSSSVGELAAFSVGYAVYWLVTGTGRAIFGESQLVVAARRNTSASSTPPGCWVLGFCLAGLAPGVITLYATREIGGLLAGAMAVSAPFVVFSDYVRYALIVRDRLWRLLVLDLVWITCQCVGFLFLFVIGWARGYLLVGIWTFGCFVATILCLPAARLRMRGRWDGGTGRGMAGEFAVTSGLQQSMPAILFGLGFVQPLAALRAAQTLVSPLNTLTTAATTVFYGRMRHREGRARVIGARLALVLVIGTAAYGMGLLSLPQRYVEGLFGSSALAGSVLLLAIICQVAANGLMNGGVLASRLLRTPGKNLMTRITSTPILLAGPVIGTVLGGSRGLGWGLCLASVVTAVWWWLLVGLAERPASRRVGRHRASYSDVPGDGRTIAATIPNASESRAQ